MSLLFQNKPLLSKNIYSKSNPALLLRLKSILLFSYVIVYILCTLFSGLVYFNVTQIPVFAQEAPNPIKLSIPRVSSGSKRYLTKQTANNTWLYEGSLTDLDYIRYGWTQKSLDTACKQKVVAGCGYIKVYLNDDSSENNLITEHGSSPLPVSAISSKLTAGLNRIMLVFVETNNPSATSKAYLSFNYKTEKERPQISVIEPSQGTLFFEDKNKNGGVKFKIELTNFKLTSDEKESGSVGQLKVYLNDTKGKPIYIAKNSRSLGNSREVVEFTSNNLDPEAVIPDSKTSNLYFVLAKNDGQNLDIVASRQVITNFGQTLKDIGIPEVKIIDPKEDRIDLTLDGNRKFLLEVTNFDLLSQLTAGQNDSKQGYLQIFVDDIAVQTIWPNKEFTLNDIRYSNTSEGKKKLKVQLVNKDFTRLTPEASATLEFVYKDYTKNNDISENIQVDNTNWRLIFIGIIVLTVIIGITILVFRG